MDPPDIPSFKMGADERLPLFAGRAPTSFGHKESRFDTARDSISQSWPLHMLCIDEGEACCSDLLSQYLDHYIIDVQSNYPTNGCYTENSIRFIMFSNRWETFLKYLQGTDDYYLVQAIEQSISALKAWGSLLDASAMLICSECIYDDLLQGITVPFNVKNIPKPFIPISPEDLQLRPQYVQALVQTTSNIDQLIFCFPITSQDTAPLL
jgi:hypothetical protein